jgi:hypothetical protein
MEREECDLHDVENKCQVVYGVEYGYPEVVAPNPNHQPRSQVVVPAQSSGVTQASGVVDNIAITVFLALAPHLRSVAYPNNFKTNI